MPTTDADPNKPCYVSLWPLQSDCYDDSHYHHKELGELSTEKKERKYF